MKKVILIMGLFVLLVSILGISIYLNSQPSEPPEEKINIFQSKVEEYLVREKGYKSNDIFSIETMYNLKNPNDESAYRVHVVFSDEKEMEYQYGIDNDKVFQDGYSGEKEIPIHAE